MLTPRGIRLLYTGCLLAAIAAPAVGRDRIEQKVAEVESGFGHDRSEAAESLLRIDPEKVDRKMKNRIAKAFRDMALDSTNHDMDLAVQGLTHWAGKYSTPVLIEIVESAKLEVDEAVYEALIELEDPDGAAAVAGMLGNFFNHDEAVECLTRMGAVAEPGVIAVAKGRPGKASLGAIEVLGEIGGPQGLAALKRLSKRGPAEQRSAARLAAARLGGRVGGSDDDAPDDGAIDPDNPFAEPVTAASEAIGRHPPEGDWSDVLQPLPDTPDPGSFVPDPAPSDAATPERLRPARLAESARGELDQPIGVLTVRDRPGMAAVATRDPFKKRAAKVQLVNLTNGKSRRPLEFPPGMTQAALSPSGKRLAMTAEEGTHDDRMRIDVWQLGAKSPSLIDSWRPFRRDDKIHSADAMWIAWVDEEHFLTLNRAGDLVLWQAEGAVAKVQFDVDGWSRPVLSPGGRQVAALTPDGLAVFDALSGETVAYFTDSPKRSASIGFNAAGDRLACVEETRVRVWDLSTGETSRDFSVKDATGRSDDFANPVAFIDDSTLVVRGAGAVDVIDLDSRRVLARGEHQARVGAGAGRFSLLAHLGMQRSAIYPEAMRHKEPAAVEDPDALLAIKPGSQVALDVRVGGGLDSDVRDILTSAAESAGLEVVASSPYTFVARKETRNDVMTYRGFHTPHWVDDSEKVNVNEKVYTVVLHIDGEPAWRFVRNQKAQHMIHGKQGESTQQTVDRMLTASARYFEGIQFPRRLVHPDHAGPLETVALRGNR